MNTNKYIYLLLIMTCLPLGSSLKAASLSARSASVQDLLEEKFTQLHKKQLTGLYADKGLTDKQMIQFCEKCQHEKYIKCFKDVRVIDLSEREKITVESIATIGNCRAFSGLARIRIEGIHTKPQPLIESLQNIIDSKIIGSERDLMQISEKYELPISEVHIAVDQDMYKACQEYIQQQKMPDKKFIHEDFVINYRAESLPRVGIKWVQIVDLG